jgi:stalled ribosome alternative rescue factor ArfA
MGERRPRRRLAVGSDIMKHRNPAARVLRDPRFRPRVVKPRKGRGSYTRKARSPRRAPASSA